VKFLTLVVVAIAAVAIVVVAYINMAALQCSDSKKPSLLVKLTQIGNA
jgi:hypothetical protein